MLSYEKLIELIDFIKLILSENKDINNIYEILEKKYYYYIERGEIHKKDILFLTNIIYNNIDTVNDVLLNIFINSNRKVEQKILISSTIGESNIFDKNKESYIELFFSLLNNYAKISIIMNEIIFLWNIEKEENVDKTILSKSFIETSSLDNETNIRIKYISYKSLEKKLLDDKEHILFTKRYINFDNLYRIIGLPISSRGYKLNYFFEFKIDNIIFNCNIYDNIAVKNIEISIDNKKFKTKIKNIQFIIENTITNIIDKLIIEKKYKEYYKMFLMIKELNDYFYLLFPSLNIFIIKKPILSNDSIIYKEIIKKKIFNLNLNYCEHEADYENLFSIDINYNENMNKFLEKYIIYEEYLPICKLCGKHLELFNMIEKNYIQKRGEIIITLTKENIFNYGIYGKFSEAQIFMIIFLSSFDNIFKTNRYNEINNIFRLVIDFFIKINENRLEYEKEFKDDINNNNLFILRLTNDFFNLENDQKEKYYDKKILNMYIIISFVTILTLTLNELLGIVINNKINIDDNTKFLDIILKILEIFLKRNKLTYLFIYNYSNDGDKMKLTKEQTNIVKRKLLNIINRYLSILTVELNNHYIVLENNFYKNIYNFKDNIQEITIYGLKRKSKDINIRSIDKTNKKKNRYIYTITYNQVIPKIIKERQKYLYIDDFLIKKNEFSKEYFYNSEINDLIKNLKVIYYYKSKEINEISEINEMLFYLKIKNEIKILEIEKYLKSSDIYMKPKSIFCFFNFGDPCPYINKISSLHFKKIIDGLNAFISIFFPDYMLVNVLDDITTSRDFIYYLKYMIFSNLIGLNLTKWIYDNKEKIKNEFFSFLTYYLNINQLS